MSQGAERPALGLVGCGIWGRKILRELLGLGARVAVVEPDPAARAAVAPDPRVTFTTLEALEAVAGIVVATPASTHIEVVPRALAHGVPVFCEKPLTTSAQDAERLVALGGERLFVMHVWRYHPGITALAAIARASELGPVQGLVTTRTNWVSPRTDVDPIWTLLPHDVSIALAILGAIPTPRDVLIDRDARGLPAGLYANSGGVTEPWFIVEASTRYADKRREVRLHARDGVAVLAHGEATYLEIATGAGLTPVIERRAFDPRPALAIELEAFVAHLEGGPPPPTTAAEGLVVVRAVEALRRLGGLA